MASTGKVISLLDLGAGGTHPAITVLDAGAGVSSQSRSIHAGYRQMQRH